MNNLVIGSTSQLSHYFPEDYIKISSRNIDFDYLKNNKWNSVYITFAEQRIYDKNIDFITPNYLYTFKIIENLINNSDKIVCYTSCELWGYLYGPISTYTTPHFDLKNEYAISKLLLLNKIKELREINNIYKKVIFIHPFYFNSTFRNEYFLFGKIFKSIVNKEKIKVGNLDFWRDMVHTKFVVDKSIEATKDTMVGSGALVHVLTFIKDLYKLNGLNYFHYVDDDVCGQLPADKEMFAKVDWNYSYQNLIDDTMLDIENYRKWGKGEDFIR